MITKNTYATTSPSNFLSIDITIVKLKHDEREIRVIKVSNGIKSE